MRFGSVCSGIEAASVAFTPLGWEPAWFAEIEPFPSAVLAHHYPDVVNLGDFTGIGDRIRAGGVEAPDLLCGGTPCQAFSVAGRRESLDDARGNLSLSFVELADAVDDVRVARGAAPAIIFWENVPGVLSTKDNAFGCFLAGLAGEIGGGGEVVPLVPAGRRWTNSGCVFGPRRVIAWRVLDAQHFGLAQRRKRVFVVASARQDFDPVAVLLVESGLCGDPAPGSEAGEGTPCSPTLRAGGNRTGGHRPPGTDVDTVESLVVTSGAELAKSLRAQSQLAHREVQDTLILNVEHGLAEHGSMDPYLGSDLAISLDANYGKGPGGRGPSERTVVLSSAVEEVDCPDVACNTGPGGHDAGNFMCNQAVDAGHLVVSECEVTHALTGEGFDASEDGTDRGVPLTLAIRGRGDGCDLEYRQDGLSNAVLTPGGGRSGIGCGAVAIQEDNQNGVTMRETAGSLRSNAPGTQPCGTLCFTPKDYGGDVGELAPTLRSAGRDKSHANGGCGPAVACFDPNQITHKENRSQPKPGICHTLPNQANSPVVFQLTGDRSNPGVSTYDDIHPTLSANPMSDRIPAVAFLHLGNTGANQNNVKVDGLADALDTTGRVAVGYDILGTPATTGAKTTGVHTPLRSRTPGQSEASTNTVILEPAGLDYAVFACDCGAVTRLSLIQDPGGDVRADLARPCSGCGRFTSGQITYPTRAGGVDADVLRAEALGDLHDLIPPCSDPISANEAKTYTHEDCTFRLHNCVPATKEPRGYVPDVSPTVTTRIQGSSGRAPVNETSHLVCDPEAGPDLAQPLRSNPYNNSDPGMEARQHVRSGMQIRRLMPVECARLQGFPDTYLDIDFRGKPATDGHKYKALGNSWAVPCVNWIGARIDAEVHK